MTVTLTVSEYLDWHVIVCYSSTSSTSTTVTVSSTFRYHLVAIMSNRLAQVSGHVTNTYGRGLLAEEVAIITG